MTKTTGQNLPTLNLPYIKAFPVAQAVDLRKTHTKKNRQLYYKKRKSFFVDQLEVYIFEDNVRKHLYNTDTTMPSCSLSLGLPMSLPLHYNPVNATYQSYHTVTDMHFTYSPSLISHQQRGYIYIYIYKKDESTPRAFYTVLALLSDNDKPGKILPSFNPV